MTHTPGGWNRNIKPASKYNVIYAGRNTHVAALSTSGLSEEEIEANCNLIAAAPDLLAECKRAQDELASALRDGREHFDYEMLNRWYNGVTAAINKAEGK